MKKILTTIIALLAIVSCGGSPSGTDVNGMNYYEILGAAPNLTSVKIYDNNNSIHVPPAIWKIDDYMRFEVKYSDDDNDADVLELMVYDMLGNIYEGPIYFDLDSEAGWFYTNQDQLVEGEPGIYNLEFRVVDSNGNESDALKEMIIFQ